MKKLICFTLIFFLFANLYPANYIHNIKIKTKDETKRESKILCCGAKGLILWNSNLPYKAELLTNYAEYILYSNIKFIQTKNKMNFIPLLVSLMVGIILVVDLRIEGPAPNKYMLTNSLSTIIIFFESFLTGMIGTIATIFIPRRHKASSISSKKKISKQYIMYTQDLPIEIENLLIKYEK